MYFYHCFMSKVYDKQRKTCFDQQPNVLYIKLMTPFGVCHAETASIIVAFIHTEILSHNHSAICVCFVSHKSLRA